MSENNYWLTKPQQITVYGEILDRHFYGQALAPNYIYFRQMIDSIFYKFSTGETIPELAYKAAPKMLKERMNRDKKSVVARNVFGDFIPQFKEFKAKEMTTNDLKLSTMKVIERTLPKILGFWKNKFLFKLDVGYDVKIKNLDCWEAQFDQYCDWFRVHNSGETMFNAVKYLNAYVNWMHKNGIIKRRVNFKDPNAKIERKQRKIENTKILSESDLTTLLEKSNPRQQLAILFGYFMAFRISDVTELEWDRINLDSEDPYIEFLGDDKEETYGKAPLNRFLYRALVELKKTSSSKWVFPQKTDVNKHFWPQNFNWESLFEKAKLENATFHTLRHTRLTLDFGNPKLPDSDVMIMRRVSFKVALEHYIHPSKDNRKRMAEADSSHLSDGVQKKLDVLNLFLFKE